MAVEVKGDSHQHTGSFEKPLAILKIDRSDTRFFAPPTLGTEFDTFQVQKLENCNSCKSPDFYFSMFRSSSVRWYGTLPYLYHFWLLFRRKAKNRYFRQCQNDHERNILWCLERVLFMSITITYFWLILILNEWLFPSFQSDRCKGMRNCNGIFPQEQ